MTRTGRAALAVSLGLMLAGCASQPAPQAAPRKPEVKAAPPTPIAAKKVELGAQTWDPQWDQLVEESLPPELLSAGVARDVQQFCPHFATISEVDKRAFWAYFFQALAGAEAGLQPATSVRHANPEVARKDAVTHRTVHQEGLLQLAYMDAQRYGCDFDWDKDKTLAEKDPAKTILQPRNNLTCGVKILRHQLIDQRKPLLSRSSYWATLQPGRPSYRVFAKQMSNVPAVCRQPASQTAARRTDTATP